ncbi:hypothetical protein R3W88_031829 [Solanum pinnatisectum]|uniref:Reverse transcriptase zinc-binding domain-containing protein n=1 Tax=Solanum pinnatisectum TaxID=50273 RepID=A0AAV9LRB3_9SOLN|nr:hypothetical protein R3W88_031829 [Solanum pinnatisectum]
MKGIDIILCQIPSNATWIIRKIMEAMRYVSTITSTHGSLGDRLEEMVHNGKFSIKCMYTTLRPQYPKVRWKSLLSHLEIHPQHKFCLWLALHQRLPTVDKLQSFGLDVPKACILCAAPVETLTHLLFDCPITNSLWSRMLKWAGEHRPIGYSQVEVAHAVKWAKKSSGNGGILSSLFAMVVTVIWRGRNLMRFQRGQF